VRESSRRLHTRCSALRTCARSLMTRCHRVASRIRVLRWPSAAASMSTRANTWIFGRLWWTGYRVGSTAGGRTTSAREPELRSSSGQLEKLRRQFWADAFVFMLEKDEGVFPFLVFHALHPVLQIII